MKVKHVNFEYQLEGSGIVNNDSSKQNFTWNRESKNGNKNKFTSINNNNMYAKKQYFRNDDGVLDYKIKISSDCVRNAIFSGDAIATNANILQHKVLLNSFIGSTLGLIRGYMFAGKKETVKRKSPLTITSATQDNDSESFMEISTKGGDKTVHDSDENASDTLRNTEAIGDITYRGKGFIDVAGLELLSCDPIFDRYSFNSDDYGILKTFLSANLPDFDSELGYYRLKTSAIDVSEYGIKLKEQQIKYLIKETLKRILNINISRATAYAKISKLRIQLVNDALNLDSWIEINSISDIDKLDFEIEEFYTLVDGSEAEKQRSDIEEAVKASIEADKKAKADKKNKKK